MRKLFAILGALLAITFAIPAFAGYSGRSSIFQLYLYEKDPITWQIVEDGAWGKMTYNTATGKFVFNGHGLEPYEGYTLINFARVDGEWPATINILGQGDADEECNVHIMGKYAFANLKPDTTPGADESGAKIWLVLTEDVVYGKLADWNPSAYLFEYELIPFP